MSRYSLGQEPICGRLSRTASSRVPSAVGNANPPGLGLDSIPPPATSWEVHPEGRASSGGRDASQSPYDYGAGRAHVAYVSNRMCHRSPRSDDWGRAVDHPRPASPSRRPSRNPERWGPRAFGYCLSCCGRTARSLGRAANEGSPPPSNAGDTRGRGRRCGEGGFGVEPSGRGTRRRRSPRPLHRPRPWRSRRGTGPR